MKTRTLFYSITALFSSLFISNISGQTVAVGHISAEIVEAVSASSSASTNLELGSCNSRFNNSTYENSALILESVKLGSIYISSGLNVACNLTLKSASLVDEKGNGFSIEPVANVSGTPESSRIDGSQTIELAGMARLSADQASGLYHGSYTLVFAYN
jgi:hypothetical protein